MPKRSKILNARVSHLEVYIPSDIYNTGIYVKIDGIHARVELDKGKASHSTSRKRETNESHRTELAEARFAQNNEVKTKEVPRESVANGIIPTARSVAESFLQHEDHENLQNLQVTMQEDSQCLRDENEINSSDYDETEKGTGVALSLPSFLSDFLQGIVDRLRVKIINVILEVNAEAEVNHRSGILPKDVFMSLKLRIGEIEVDTIFTENCNDQDRTGKPTASDSDLALTSEYRVVLHKISCSLICDPDALVGLSHVCSSPSPVGGRFSELNTQNSKLGTLSFQPNADEPSLVYDYERKGGTFEPATNSPKLIDNLTRSRSSVDIQYQSKALNDESIQIPLSKPKLVSLQDAANREYLDSDVSPNEDDLARSMIFSHEEAASMYYSIIDENIGEREDSSSTDVYSTHKTKILGALESNTNPTATHKCSHGYKIEQKDNNSESNEPKVRDGNKKAESQPSTERLKETPILTMDNIVYRLPKGGKSSAGSINTPENRSASQGSPGKNMFKTSPQQPMPGSFSHYVEDGERRGSRSSKEGPAQSKKQIPSSPRKAESFMSDNDQFDLNINAAKVRIGSLYLNLDNFNGRILHALLGQILNILSPDEDLKDTQHYQPADQTIHPEVDVHVEKITARYLDELVSFAECDSNVNIFDKWVDERRTNVLLEACADNLNVKAGLRNKAKETHFTMSTLRIGFANETIISFDTRTRMRTSTRDLRDTKAADVTCGMIKTNQQTRIHISTLPIVVNLDIHKIDDFLDKLGGLGSIVELGTSISSNSTVQRLSQAERQRKTEIQVGSSSQNVQNILPQFKLNARIAGSLFTLKAKACSLVSQSSAIKIVNRDGNIVLQIDEANISNQPRTIETDKINLIHLRNNRIHFLSSPEEHDLDQLVTLVAPSKGSYDDGDNKNDDVLLDTLLAQRKKGSLLRFFCSLVDLNVPSLKDMSQFLDLGDELNRLTSVKKYLPAESRPGMLILSSIELLNIKMASPTEVGISWFKCEKSSIAYTGVPSMLALSINKTTAQGSGSMHVLHEILGTNVLDEVPMIMALLLGEELEPLLKIKLNNTCFEYNINLAMALFGLSDEATTEDISVNLATSLSTVTGKAQSLLATNPREDLGSVVPNGSQPMKLQISFQDCAIGLNPRDLRSKGLFILSKTKFNMERDEFNVVATLDVHRASLLIIDDVARLADDVSKIAQKQDERNQFGNSHIELLCNMGYISVSTISAAKADIKIVDHGEDASVRRSIDVDLKDDLFILETCADSTQTTIEILNGLKPPKTIIKDTKYRTEVVPMHDMMASFSGEEYINDSYGNDYDDATGLEGDLLSSEMSDSSEFPGNLYDIERFHHLTDVEKDLADNDLKGSELSPSLNSLKGNSQIECLKESYVSEGQPTLLDFKENYFEARPRPTNENDKGILEDDDSKYQGSPNQAKSPLTVRLRDVHIIWNLFDGYDWPATRHTITSAVKNLELKAEERQRERQKYKEAEGQEEPVIGDYLFNSIWIDIAPNKNPRELSKEVNRNVDDRASETESQATSTLSSSPSRSKRSRGFGKRLRLERGRHHKITFELKGVSVDLILFPPEDDLTQSSLNIRIADFEIFDHVPSSTWKKFATYMRDAGEREMGKPMIKVEVVNVKPVAELAASELVIRVCEVCLVMYGLFLTIA